MSETDIPDSCFSPAIGIFDSGVGGLSVLRAVRQHYPTQPVIYFADQAHVPYGSRSLEEVLRFSKAITRFLIDEGAKLIIVACNTASAAALHSLRAEFPKIPFVGMEPAVKPAAEMTRTGVVGVLATPATFQGALYASVVERFARDVTILQDTCPGLVTEIEAGRLEGEQTRLILETALNPMLAKCIDTVVMGCTHYPFVIPLIQKIIKEFPGNPDVRVIDPAQAIARQTGRMLRAHALCCDNPESAPIRYITSGDPSTLQTLLPQLMGDPSDVIQAFWDNGRLRTV